MEEFDIKTTILTQYQKSTKLLDCIDTFKYIDPASGINKIYNEIYNINTATTYGLDVWGLILNVSRYIEITTSDFFGFNGTGYSPFNVFPFYDGKASGNFRLENEQYRKLLLVVCFRNISNASLTDLNKITKLLYGDDGTCKVEKVSTMKIRFTFDFTPDFFQIAILQNENIVPIPTGVQYEIITP